MVVTKAAAAATSLSLIHIKTLVLFQLSHLIELNFSVVGAALKGNNKKQGCCVVRERKEAKSCWYSTPAAVLFHPSGRLILRDYGLLSIKPLVLN